MVSIEKSPVDSEGDSAKPSSSAEETFPGMLASDAAAFRSGALTVASQFEAFIESAPVAMLVVDATGHITVVNHAAQLLFGYDRSELIGQAIEILIPDEIKPKHGQLFAAFTRQPVARPMGKGGHLSALRKDGSRLSVEIALNPILAEGRLESVILWVTDRSERERAESAEFLIKELTHRARNMFTIISAISRQVARSSADIGKYRLAFEDRLESLATSYRVFEKSSWRGAPIVELIRSQIAFVERDEGQFEIDGPDMFLPANTAEHLGLAIHELAANALKYGALSVPEGRVQIRWSVDDTAGLFRFSWIERSSRTFSDTQRQGFGSIILKSIVPAACAGSAHLAASPAGMTWQLEAPISFTSRTV